MNLKEIKEMIQLMNENSLTEFEMEQDGLKIRLKKGSGGAIESSVVPAEGRSASPKASGAESKEPSKTATPAKNVIKSPMVGTFYAAPAPDAQPFLQIGSQVDTGQVVCIIEAMKLMNEIKSEIHGRVVEILVHNGDPVEFGQPLFVLE